ncbi:MAG: ferredoxin [Candidatus Magasanikbacteria bacterium CG10_big_fil_rev_8_21_14_0_10_36_32]|uniref:Ferredoxin n=1 Tax=Candidatus Magasanikbacteria bacterium CG10_big_fil_rev_8_21_14_0_10_36_32 TaxID=1974646 RepID=A0A2M6W7N4_9BACT|nr:MAG: ferredoxin [Candidatus Magasanikbacteria bacterium CG10_big_fil_rev_8_21_14_0_10_36_32]
MALQVDKEKCLGCGSCIAIAPNTFKLSDESKAEIINPEGDSQEIIKQASEACPTEAITL